MITFYTREGEKAVSVNGNSCYNHKRDEFFAPNHPQLEHFLIDIPLKEISYSHTNPKFSKHSHRIQTKGVWHRNVKFYERTTFLAFWCGCNLSVQVSQVPTTLETKLLGQLQIQKDLELRHQTKPIKPEDITR